MLRLRIYTQFFLILPLFVVTGNASRQCDPSDLNDVQCSETELCDITTKSCQCPFGYERKNITFCEPKVASPTQSTPNYSSLVDNQGSGSLIAGILIPVFLIVVVICGIYANRKYQILTWVRNKLHRRDENYDEYMIGQDLDDDDPPLRC